MMCRFPPEPSGDYLEQEIQVDPRRITIETDDRSGYHRIRAEGMTPVRGAGNEGAPDLPGLRRNLLLPPGMRIAEILVVASERTRIEGEFVPEPVPNEDGDRLPDSYYYDDREGAVFPVEPAAVIANDALRGISLGDYVVVPFEWDPTERALFGTRPAGDVTAAGLALDAIPIAAGLAVRLSIPGEGDYEVRAYDVAGRLVRELFRGPLSPGHHEIIWNHQDEAAREVASGVYFLRVRRMGGNDEQATARSVIVR